MRICYHDQHNQNTDWSSMYQPHQHGGLHRKVEKSELRTNCQAGRFNHSNDFHSWNYWHYSVQAIEYIREQTIHALWNGAHTKFKLETNTVLKSPHDSGKRGSDKSIETKAESGRERSHIENAENNTVASEVGCTLDSSNAALNTWASRASLDYKLRKEEQDDDDEEYNTDDEAE